MSMISSSLSVVWVYIGLLSELFGDLRLTAKIRENKNRYAVFESAITKHV
jgi:hypothetical protein